jgi:hypothetical protein
MNLTVANDSTPITSYYLPTMPDGLGGQFSVNGYSNVGDGSGIIPVSDSFAGGGAYAVTIDVPDNQLFGYDSTYADAIVSGDILAVTGASFTPLFGSPAASIYIPIIFNKGGGGSAYSGPWTPTLSLSAGTTSGGTAYVAPVSAFSFYAKSGSNTGGSIAIGPPLPLGSFDDFGWWEADQPDSALSLVLAWATHTDTAWSRQFVAATAPQDYYGPGGSLLWLGAKYVAVGQKWLATQETHYYDAAMVEVQTYQNLLPPDAANHENGTLYFDETNPLDGNVTTSTAQAYSGSRSLAVTIPTGFIYPTFGALTFVQNNPTLLTTGSVMIAHPRAGASVGVLLSYYDSSLNLLGQTKSGDSGKAALVTHPGGLQWVEATLGDFPSFGTAIAWVGVSPYVSSSGEVTGEIYYSDSHILSIDGGNYIPSDWEAAQEMKIVVGADRINWASNPSIATSDASTFVNISAATTTYDNTQEYIGTTGSIKSTLLSTDVPGGSVNVGVGTYPGPTGGTGPLNPMVGLLPVGQWYTFSQWVRPNSLDPLACPPIYLGVQIGGLTSDNFFEGTNTAYVLANHGTDINYVDSGWVRLWVSAFLPDTGSGITQVQTYSKSQEQLAGIDTIFWVDDTLVEVGQALLPYFDGNSPGSDYLWESGGSTGGRSHFYRDLQVNKYRLSEIVQQNVPIGSNFQILYAQPTVIGIANGATITSPDRRIRTIGAAGTASGLLH